MGFDEAVLRCLARYWVVTGRAGSREFWWFAALYVGTFALGAAALLVSVEVAITVLVFAAVLTPPALAVTVRRLHDIGISGWALALPVPVLGQLFLLAWLARPSLPRRNRFGPEPGRKAERYLLYAR